MQAADPRRARLLIAKGGKVRVFDPAGLPLPDSALQTHPKVQELREAAAWSEGMVWTSPERHGAMTGIIKAQNDWIPLSVGAFRPTLLTRDVTRYLVDRYSERRENAEELSKQVNQRSI